MGRWRLGIGLAVVAVLLTVTGTAQAKLLRSAKVEVQAPRASATVDLGKRHGYRVLLFMTSGGVSALETFKIQRRGKGGTISFALYVVHTQGSLASGAVRGRFGSLGSFSLRFQPTGQVRERDVRRGCEGPPTLTERGKFVGRVSFHGKDHYLDLSLPGGSGSRTTSPLLVCEKGQASDPASKRLRTYVVPGSFFSTEGNIALLYASTRRHGRFIGITAGHQEGSPPGADVRFGMFESRNGMAIGRYAIGFEPAGTLLTSLPGEHPATATLAPPAPFFGKATYREKSARTSTWTGTLGVKLFGLRQPLTGPGFDSRLCVLNPLQTRKGCDLFKAPPQFDERPAHPWWMSR